MAQFRKSTLTQHGQLIPTDDTDQLQKALFTVDGCKAFNYEVVSEASSSAGLAAVAGFLPFSITGGGAADVSVSGSALWQDNSAGGGDSISWTNFKANKATIVYQFAASLNAANGETVAVAHIASGSSAVSPNDLHRRYLRVNHHTLFSGSQTPWTTGEFTIHVDDRLRTSGSQIMISGPTTVTIASRSIAIYEG